MSDEGRNSFITTKEKTMKHRTAVLAAVISSVCLASFNCSHYYTLQSAKQIFKLTKISDVDLSKVQDGTYVGFYDMILITAMVRVTVAGGRIETIELLEHQYFKKYSGEPVVKQVLDKQSLSVDGVTGATYSARTVLKAIERALLIGLEI
jgi:uncharacterized protein with FMN-binding domain